MRASMPPAVFDDDCLAAICLYVLFDCPARALDVAAIAEKAGAGQRAVIDAKTLYERLRVIFGTRQGPGGLRSLAALLPDGLRNRLRQFAGRLPGG
jgi:hypothetical protein